MLMGVQRSFGTLKKFGLPYDAEIDYLESSGTQWIDTGVQTGEHLIYARVFYDYYRVAYARIFGTYKDENSTCVRIILQNADNGLAYVTAGSKAGGGSMSMAFKSSVWHDVLLDTKKHTATIDSATASNQTAGTSFVSNIILFGLTGGASANTVVKISGFKIVDANTLLTIRDFIPVRFTNELDVSEAAMYDRVSGTLFRNSGTGAFSAGPDKGRPDTMVEYIESDGGGAYMETGFVIRDDLFTIECDMNSTTAGQSTSWAKYFGSYVGETTKCTRLINYGTENNKIYVGYRKSANGMTQVTIPASLGYVERALYKITRNRFEMSRNGATVASVALSGGGNAEDTSTIKLFGSAKMRCYGFRMTYNGKKIVDLAPARVGSEAVMYDRVRGTIVRKKGSGNMTAGPDVAEIGF